MEATLNPIAPSSSNIMEQIDMGHTALAQARDDFERLQVRDFAQALQAAANILNRREVQVEASMLVMDAERAIAKANPSRQGQRDTQEPTELLLGKEVKKKIRQAHSNLDDQEYKELKTQAWEEKVPLTRKRLSEIGKKKHKSERHQEMLKRKEEKNAREPSVRCDLFTSPINELITNGLIEPNSVDLVVTDPPYDREAIPLFADLVSLSAEILKPGGSLLCLGGTLFWREQLAAMEQAAEHTDLNYWWMVTYHMTAAVGAASRIFPKRVFSRWKPIFWFVRGEYTGEWAQDTFICPPKTKEVKEYHVWGQHPEVYDEMLKVFAYPGDLVCDPFLGGGTTGVSAISRGCGFVGSDIDPEAVRTTQERIIMM